MLTVSRLSRPLSHPFLQFVLFFVLALAVALPTTALAAPAHQGTGTAEAEMVAYYESDVVESPEGDVYVSVSFYDDNTFEMYIDAVDGSESSVAYGDYEENDDGVLLTVIGADNEDLDEAVEVEMVWDADDTLVIVGGADAPMGEEDIVLYPVSFATDEESGDDSDMEMDEDFVFGIAGVYVSPLQPDEGTNGVIYILNLLEDGSASLNSDYLNLEAPIFETGTWIDNGDDTVTVEITGTPDEEYDDPIIINFEVGDLGELNVEGVVLYPLIILDYLGDDSSEIGSEESEVYLYVAELISPDSDEPINIYMLLYDDGTVVLTDEEESGSVYGEWVYEDDVLYVSLYSDDDGELEETVELAFEYDDEDNLVATEYPVDIFGEDGLIFMPVENSGEEAIGEGEFYYYETDVLPSEETDGIIISLFLSGDGMAMTTTDFMNDEDPVMEYGDWTSDADGLVIVTISEGPDGVYDEPFVFTFEENQDDLSLVLVEETVEVFGDFELILYRVE